MIEYDTLKYTSIEVSNDLLASFEEEGYTYLHCTYITSTRYSSGWWVNICQDSFLTNGKEEIKMLKAMNIPLSPKKHYLKKFGDSLQFVLIFPAVPKSWDTFNFLERTQPTITKDRTFDANLGYNCRNNKKIRWSLHQQY
jgi:hypothetical protein